MLGYWPAAVPWLILGFWVATYWPKYRRWRRLQRDSERKLGKRLTDPQEAIDVLCVAVAMDRNKQYQRDDNWYSWFHLYHLPACILVRLISGRFHPLLEGGWKPFVVITVGSAIAYSAASLWLFVKV